VPSLDDEPPFDDIGTMTARVLEHATQVDFVGNTYELVGDEALPDPRARGRRDVNVADPLPRA